MTDTKTLTRDTTPDPPPGHKKLLDMSASQLVGGALAAMTSAVIGAQLGVAGTVIGAAIGSLVAGVAGSLYTASLKHTKDKLASAIVGKVGDTPVVLETVSDDTFVSEQTLVTAQTHGSGSTVVSAERGYGQTWNWDMPTESTTAAVAPASSDPVAADLVVDDQGHTVKRWPWKGILVSTAAVFLLAIAGITAFELISGQSVSGGDGTTIGQVSEGRSGVSQTTPSQDPSSTPSSDTSTTPTSEPSASSDPSSSATSEPSGEPSGSSEPTQSSEPSASSEPSTSASASAAAGDAAGSGAAGAVAGG